MVDLLLECLEYYAVAFFCALSQAACLAVIGVCPSTYHSHRKKLKKKCDRHNRQEDLQIRDLMKEFIELFGFTPGKKTFRYLISTKLGKPVSERRCGRLMREFGFIATICVRKDPYRGAATHDHPFLSPFNLVEGVFRAAPRCIIATDITYIYYGLGCRNVCYLCIYLDCFTQEVLGWSVDDTMDTAFVLDAYEMMMRDHGTELKRGYTILHSDGGSQYMAGDYRDRLILDRFRQSCSRRGTPTDNAVIECFNGLFKATALLNLERAGRLEDVRTMCGNWLQQSNLIPRDQLAGLSPSQYYSYTTTGVFPADSYLGIPADHLSDPEWVMAHRQAMAEKGRERRRKTYRDRSDMYRNAADPMKKGSALEWMKQRIARDLCRMKALDAKLGGIIDSAEKNDKQALRVIDWIVKKAMPYVVTLTEEQAEELRNDTRKWLEHEPLNYIKEMAMLF